MTLFTPEILSKPPQPVSNGHAEPCSLHPRAAPAPDQASQLRALMRHRDHQAGPEAAIAGEEPAITKPVSPTDCTVAPTSLATPAPARQARVIAITSGKGGVGKTNLAVNLAARFAQAGRRTLLIDADMGLANADVLCGLSLRHNLSHVIARRLPLTEVIAEAPGGFQLIGGASGLATMADLPQREHQRLLDELAQLEAAYDLIFIDTGAGISRSVLSFTSAADQVLVVTTPEPTAIADAYATIKVITRRRNPANSSPISLVVNQARKASEASRVYNRIAKVARSFLDAELGDAGFLPADPAVGKAVCQRSPFVVSYPKCAASVCVTRLARRLEAGLTSERAARPVSHAAGVLETFAILFRPRPVGVFP